jgi:hypothetical protein
MTLGRKREASQSYSAELNCVDSRVRNCWIVSATFRPLKPYTTSIVLDLHGCFTVEVKDALRRKIDECYKNGVRFTPLVRHSD